ncbi:RNA polymerase sigma factor [Steroidobacter sp.]|uniref:RNA polymerase sigma factor n=1 Tax=Steroidobacter sp. TaxID=1978227 RepID=UPI001A56A091|nr:sigma-70 family RNA polymerase sigma factor [Steroidobacter sp.]MBL8271934.1 sigma-70 family RNA polymerase sigma factor [Steroidobacter sp.]
MSESLQDWFKREIVVHERALLRYIRNVWPQLGEVEDIRQEAYIRVYEAAGVARPDAPKSFLFTVVRNIMADRIRRRRVVSIEMQDDLDALNILIDENSPEHCVGVREEFLKLVAAFEALPIECRDVVWLRKVERLTQKDVSRRLGVSQRTIEKRVARGIRILAKAVFNEAPDPKVQAEVSTDRTEREHG